MYIDWIKLFVRIFLISPHLKIHFSWKDVSHQLVNTALPLPFPKKIISCIWPKPLITDATIEHKQYLNDVALCTVRYSCRLSTAGTTLLFKQSVNNTNTTVHILQCVTVMEQDTDQQLVGNKYNCVICFFLQKFKFYIQRWSIIFNVILEGGLPQCDIWSSDRGLAPYAVCTKYSCI